MEAEAYTRIRRVRAAMAYVFGTEEWIKAYRDEINQSGLYKKVGATWEGDFFFVIIPSSLME